MEEGCRDVGLTRMKITSKAHFCLLWVVAISALSALAGQAPAARMTFLDNGEVRIGMDLALGGAVTFISICGYRTDGDQVDRALARRRKLPLIWA